MHDAATQAFKIVADNIYFLHHAADVRDIIQLCRLNKTWQADVANQKTFWQHLSENVHIYNSLAAPSLSFHIGESIREIKKMGFEIPSFFGMEQIKFINLCARTFARIHLYSHEDQLEIVPEGISPYLALQRRMDRLLKVYLHPLSAKERQQIATFPLGTGSHLAAIGNAHAQITAMANEIDLWIKAHKDHFASLRDKLCNFKKAFTHEMPHEIGLFSGLKKLELIQVSKLPDEMGELLHLETLMIDNQNRVENLHEIPSCLLQLKRLKKLNLVGCKLLRLPKDFHRLKNLTRLSLRTNGLTEFPPELFRLKKLKSLNLMFNQINIVGYGIKGLSSLESLILQHNKLEELPKSICNLPLKRLNINDNPIKFLPEGLAIEQLRRPSYLEPGKSQSTTDSECEHMQLEKHLLFRRDKLDKKTIQYHHELKKSSTKRKNIVEEKLTKIQEEIKLTQSLESNHFQSWKQQKNIQEIASIKRRIAPERLQAISTNNSQSNQIMMIFESLGPLGPLQCSAIHNYQIKCAPPQVMQQRRPSAPSMHADDFARECSSKEQEAKALKHIENDLTAPGAITSLQAFRKVNQDLENLGALSFQQHRIAPDHKQTLEIIQQHYTENNRRQRKIASKKRSYPFASQQEAKAKKFCPAS